MGLTVVGQGLNVNLWSSWTIHDQLIMMKKSYKWMKQKYPGKLVTDNRIWWFSRIWINKLTLTNLQWQSDYCSGWKFISVIRLFRLWFIPGSTLIVLLGQVAGYQLKFVCLWGNGGKKYKCIKAPEVEVNLHVLPPIKFKQNLTLQQLFISQFESTNTDRS